MIELIILLDFISLKNAIEWVKGGDSVIDVSKRLSDLMEERGLNTYSLARKSNIAWNTVKNYSTRNTKPTLATLSALCDGLGITLVQFFDTEGTTVQLTAQQQHLINRWNMLSEKEKRVISDMIDLIIEE